MAIIGEFGSAPDYAAKGYQGSGLTVTGTDAEMLERFTGQDAVLVKGAAVSGSADSFEYYPMLNTASPLFLTNKEFCFFEVHFPLDVSALVDVVFYPSLQVMIEAVSEATKEPVEDLEHCVIVVAAECGEYQSCDSRGLWSLIDDEDCSIEQWISDCEV